MSKQLAEPLMVVKDACACCREYGGQRQVLGKEGGLAKGHISPRMGVIIAYLALLHLAVMMCFTRHHSAPDCTQHSLPGR